MQKFVRLVLIAVLSCCMFLSVSLLPAQGISPPIIQTGQAQYQAGRYAEAAQSLEQAIADYRSSNQRLALARTLSLQALAFDKLGRWRDAHGAIDQSLSLIADLRRHDAHSASILNLTEAQVLSAQGKLQRSQGQTKAALGTWKKAELLYQQEDDTTGIIGSRINQIKALETLGFYRRAEKQLDDMAAQLQALPDSPLKARGLLSFGTLLRIEGQLHTSETTLRQGLESLEKANNANADQLQSQLLLSLANTERLLGNRAIAIPDRSPTPKADQHPAQDYFQAASEHYSTAAQLTADPVENVQIQLNHLSLLQAPEANSNLGNPQQLARQIFQALPQLPVNRRSIYAKVNFVQQMSNAPASETKAKASLGLNTNRLETMLRQAVQQAEVLEDARSQSYALGALGHWQERQSNGQEGAQKTEAQALTRSALDQAQRINAPEIAYQWQWQLGRLLQTEARTAPQTEALGYYQAAYNTLNELRSDLVALAPDIQFSFREQVEPVYREFVDLLLRDPQQANLLQARSVIEDLQLAELDNFFRDACAQAQPTSIDEIDATTAIVYPILLDDRLEIILKLPGQDTLRHFVQPNVSSQDVEQVVRQFRALALRRSANFETFASTANQLYRWLIAPMAEEIETALSRDDSSIKTLAFVLDGGLRSLPMAALYDGEQFLVERYAIAITPGLQLFDPKPLARQNLRVLLGGTDNAPSFEAEGLSELPNVPFELEEIQAQLLNSGLLQQAQFQKGQISEKLNSQAYNVVHLATHGQFSSDPEQTFVLDWDGRINVAEMDQLLQFSDPTQANNIELLVLSACETAKGDSRAALGLAGVAIRAGARSTLATLWQVNDFSTSEFMIKFYQQLSQSNQTKAEILRNVQLSFLNDYPEEDFETPYHWAPFILVGNWL